jgi:hypothetical protein
MTEEDIKHLVPLYVAGTLGPDEQKAVEEGLQEWPELKKDLEFWMNSATAVRLQAAFEAGAHPATEDLVAYAEWSLKDRARRLEIDHHLQTCAPCADAYALIQGTEHLSQPLSPSLLERVSESLQRFKPVHLVPAVIFAALIAFILIPQMRHSPETAQLWLTYEPELRSARAVPLPVLSLGNETEDVRLVFVFPHSEDAAVTYDLRLQHDQSPPRSVLTMIKPFYRGQPNDSLSVTILAGEFADSGDRCRFIIVESPGSIQGTALPPMVFPFTITRRK